MFGIGKAVLVGLGLLGVAMVVGGGGSSSTPAKATGGTLGGTPAVRFTIKQNITTVTTTLPIEAFKPGDILNVVLHDAVKNIDIPINLTVAEVGTDSMVASFTNIFNASDLPSTGTRFDVYPADVLLRTPGLPVGDGTPKLYTLDTDDVIAGPNSVAAIHGFLSVNDMVNANLGTLSDVSATPEEIVAFAPGVYTSVGPTPTMRKIVPWNRGIVINVKSNPDIPPLAYVAGDGFGGSGFGGRGFGVKA